MSRHDAYTWADTEGWFTEQCYKTLGLPQPPRGAFTRFRFAVEAAGVDEVARQRAGGYLLREIVDDFFLKRPPTGRWTPDAPLPLEGWSWDEYVGLVLQAVRLMKPWERHHLADYASSLSHLDVALEEDRSISPVIERLLFTGRAPERAQGENLVCSEKADSLSRASAYQYLMWLLRPWVIRLTERGVLACIVVLRLYERLPYGGTPEMIRCRHRFGPRETVDPQFEKTLLSKLEQEITQADKDAAHTVIASYSGLLRSRGFHAKLPRSLWIYLKTSLHVDFELFASPFNHTLQRCCTMYPLADRHFLPECAGTAFDFKDSPPPGARVIEINPPFGEAILEMVVTLVHGWLKNGVDISCVLFLPYWANGPSCRFIDDARKLLNPWCRASVVLSAGDHGYEDALSGKWFPSACPTLVLLLSTAAKEPVADDFGFNLQKTFYDPARRQNP